MFGVVIRVLWAVQQGEDGPIFCKYHFMVAGAGAARCFRRVASVAASRPNVAAPRPNVASLGTGAGSPSCCVSRRVLAWERRGRLPDDEGDVEKGEEAGAAGRVEKRFIRRAERVERGEHGHFEQVEWRLDRLALQLRELLRRDELADGLVVSLEHAHRNLHRRACGPTGRERSVLRLKPVCAEPKVDDLPLVLAKRRQQQVAASLEGERAREVELRELLAVY
mmetsp:Transcript_59808/g.129650  ORF Transcript_59808/g.129650 Transcript_59808/m.129650 type:complete len:223 (+) Transcript_59808:535-1203(+)